MECGERLEKIGFDGYGFGGWPLDSEGKLRLDVLKMAADAMPDHKLKYAMGLGKPEEIVQCVEMGYRLFDCVIPTREARHNRLRLSAGHGYGGGRALRADVLPLPLPHGRGLLPRRAQRGRDVATARSAAVIPAPISTIC